MKGNRGGFIKIIVIIVIGLVVLGFFGYNLRSIIDSPNVRDNLKYGWELAVKLWQNFLVGPATWIWNNVVVDLIWNNIKSFLK